MDLSILFLNLSVSLGAAFIGTYWGIRKLFSYKDKEKEKIRAIAIKGLRIFYKYIS